MTRHQPKHSTALRVIAASCVALWLLASSYCGIEDLLRDDHHHAEVAASESVAHHVNYQSHDAGVELASGEASQHDSQESPPDSQPHDGGGDACCSALLATAQIAMPFVIAKPILQPLNLLCMLLPARDPMVALPEAKLERRAIDRDWVFTPEVCLGPAHLSLAPPPSHQT